MRFLLGHFDAMKQQKIYETPIILRQTALGQGCTLLSASAVTNVITSVGQKIDSYNYDFNSDGDGFNHNWEDAE